MQTIADILLAAGALGAAFYCIVLARRLRRFTELDSGMGGAIAVFSAQVDDLTRALEAARGAAQGSVGTLEERTRRAEEAAARIELLLAAMHDLPDPAADGPGGRPQRRVVRRRARDERAVRAPEDVE